MRQRASINQKTCEKRVECCIQRWRCRPLYLDDLNACQHVWLLITVFTAAQTMFVALRTIAYWTNESDCQSVVPNAVNATRAWIRPAVSPDRF